METEPATPPKHCACPTVSRGREREMSQQGAQLQGYNNELIKCKHLPNDPLSLSLSGIEDLSAKRDELHRQVLQEEEEKQRVQHDLHILTERLAAINESLARKIAIRNDYDRTIAETEGAYKKVSAFLFMCVVCLPCPCVIF